MNTDKLQYSVAYLKGVGQERAALLKTELGIEKWQDFLHLFPYKYTDRTKYYKINELVHTAAEVQIVGKITALNLVTGKTPAANRLVALFSDGMSTMELVWFKSTKWFKNHLKVGETYVVFGKCNVFAGVFSMVHPEIDILAEHKARMLQGMQAVYPSTEKLQKRNITNRLLRQFIEQIFQEVGGNFAETLPQYLIEQMQLATKTQALKGIHFPSSQEELVKAQFRLKFEELFYIQLQLAQKHLSNRRIKGYPFSRVGNYFLDFYQKHLPFALTNAQKRVIKEIRVDMGRAVQMNRLLQGDVGSGKTIVALMSMLLALDNGFQATLVAPTEILATQHFTGLSELVKPLNIHIELLTGSTKATKRKQIHTDLQNGNLQILVGTHAILEEKVVFKNLGLAITDEQHRFGVAQRSKLWLKNTLPPHNLIMSATPIPRTLAMSLYGDLDVSVIDELPPGRKPIRTQHYFEGKRSQVYSFIKEEITLGRQVYVVYPLIEESQTLDYKNLQAGYEQLLSYFPAPKYHIVMVHGRMKPTEKDAQMQAFIQGKAHIMVATTVIEVGVNVPNASVMIIESAERFGLSQLHQLRGRVGRGAEQSYCILLTGVKLSSDSRTRMDTMEKSTDGFKIAEVDLKLRGPGDMMGTQQSGVLNLKIADLVRDQEILKIARSIAFKITETDPNLTATEHTPLVQTLHSISAHKNIWSYIS